MALASSRQSARHEPVIDKSKREDGTFSRADFIYDEARDIYTCPAGKTLTTTGTLVNDGETLSYFARTRDCARCPLKAQCCPKGNFRRITRSIYEDTAILFIASHGANDGADYLMAPEDAERKMSAGGWRRLDSALIMMEANNSLVRAIDHRNFKLHRSQGVLRVVGGNAISKRGVPVNAHDRATLRFGLRSERGEVGTPSAATRQR